MNILNNLNNPPSLPPSIHAEVHPDAINHVSSFFDGTLTDIFNEMLQNARRAGATQVEITATDETRPTSSPSRTTATASPTPRRYSPSAIPNGATPPPAGRIPLAWVSTPCPAASRSR